MANSLRAALLFSILVVVCFICNGQATVPNTISGKTTNPYYEYYGRLQTDSGLLFKTQDTSKHITSPLMDLHLWQNIGIDTLPVYWNGSKWITIATSSPPSPTQWINTSTLLYPRNLSWNVGIGTATPTTPFNVTVKTRFDVPDASTTTFNKIGNVTDISGADNLNSFILYNNINSPSTAEAYGAALSGQITLRIHNTQDTFYTQSVNDGSTGLFISSFRNGANNDTSAKVMSHFGYGNTSYYTNGRNTLVSDFHAGSTDSTLARDTITKWRINMPTGSVFTKVTIPDRGVLQEYSDITVGFTAFTDTTHSNSSFLVKRHNGLNILPIDNTNTDTAYAIYQQGGTDSIYLHSATIRTDNLPSGTPTNLIGITSNGSWATSRILEASASLDFGSTGAGAVSDLTVTVTGANVGDPVFIGVPNSAVTATATYWAWVSSADTVTIRFSPKATENPSSGTFKVNIIKQ